MRNIKQYIFYKNLELILLEIWLYTRKEFDYTSFNFNPRNFMYSIKVIIFS